MTVNYSENGNDDKENTFWLEIISFYEIYSKNMINENLNKIISDAENGDINARKAIKLACEALSYSDAIAEGSYSVRQCLTFKLEQYFNFKEDNEIKRSKY